MVTNGTPALCGGTFFTLLLEAAKNGRNERKKWGEGSEFTERDVFEALVKIAAPTYEKPADSDNFKSVVSAYKSCNMKKSGRLPIYEQANISTFSNRIRDNYQTPLLDMTELVKKYINIAGKGNWLIRALLELICEDESIDGTEALFIYENGESISKGELHTLNEICIPAFLLGVWYFIVSVKTNNGTGKATYDEWCKHGKSKNTREPFKSNIGEGITRSLNLFMPSKTEDNDYITEDEPSADFTEPYEEQPDSNSTPNTTTQIIHSPAVFFNSGANGIQINNTGTLNIDRSEKREK